MAASSSLAWPPPHANATFVVGCDGCGSDGLVLAIAAQRSVVSSLDPSSVGDGPSFFGIEDRYTRGLGWYRAQFSSLPAEKDGPCMLLDGSRTLFSAPFAPARIQAALARPTAHRVVIILRDPTELAWLRWRDLMVLPTGESEGANHSEGTVTPPRGNHGAVIPEPRPTIDTSLGPLLRPYTHARNFSAKAIAEVEAFSRCLAEGRAGRRAHMVASLVSPIPVSGSSTGASASNALTADSWYRCVAVVCGWPGCVVGAGLYAPQLRGWRQAFSPHQLAVHMLSELRASPAATTRRVLRFVGLPSGGVTRLPLQRSTEAAASSAAASGSGLQRAVKVVAERAARAIAAGEGAPAPAAHHLRQFYARFAPAVRRELELMRQPLHRWSGEAWLWAEARHGQGVPPNHAHGETHGGSLLLRSTAAPWRGSASGAGGRGSADETDGDWAAAQAGLPSVFLLGGEKCGSTSLAFALSRHPQIQLARHALPGEPAYFRKEVHFFDDDLRYMRGLPFYAAHYPPCARSTADVSADASADVSADPRPGGAATVAPAPVRYWAEPPSRTSEVLLEDAATGEVVGWDAELNIPGDVARTMMLVPAGDIAHDAAPAGADASAAPLEGVVRWYWMVDSASSQLLYNRDWVLRAAPLTPENQLPARRVAFVPVPSAAAGDETRGGDAAGTPLSFWLVDAGTRRMLYWRDDVVRVRHFARDPSAAWRLRRLSDDACPHWTSVVHRHNDTDDQWARRVARIARGECALGCERGPLVRAIARELAGASRLRATTRAAVCRVTCAIDPAALAAARWASAGGKAAAGARPAAVAPASVSGCLCVSAARPAEEQLSAAAAVGGSAAPWPDCGCRGSAGAGRRLSMDATPMLHRLAAAWRMAAVLPSPSAIRLIIILRTPAERAASHFGMLRKLALRGETWARLYMRTDNASVDARLLEEARAFATCAATRAGRATIPGGRLSPKAWHECVAVACGFHACVIGQSIYEPQLRTWLNTFSAPQAIVLTLDEFAAAPRSALGRIASFLRVGAFPKLVVNWKWTWNVGRKRKRGSITEHTLSQLRVFFAPYNDALSALLRKRGQGRAAANVEQWPRT